MGFFSCHYFILVRWWLFVRAAPLAILCVHFFSISHISLPTPPTLEPGAALSFSTYYFARIYTYQAPWTVFGLAWSQRTEAHSRFRLAIGSFIEEYTNKIQLIQRNSETNALEKIGEFNHPYPATKIMFSPAKDTEHDSLATTGDYLRIWKVAPDGTVDDVPALLNNNSKSEYCAPLTSFDWNETDPNMIGTSSIDTTCTIWDRERGVATTQLIAHDKEVYDIAFAQGKNVFASVGADGCGDARICATAPCPTYSSLSLCSSFLKLFM